MKYSNFDKVEIIEYLNSYADIKSFYIYRDDGIDSGLIHYFDSSGDSWCVMEDDDALLSACLDYLIGLGCPVFENISDLRGFEKAYVSCK